VSLCSEPRACSSRSMAGSGACSWKQERHSRTVHPRSSHVSWGPA
jgi:hypothetical protein